MAVSQLGRTNNASGRPSNALLTERLSRAREVNALIRAENRALLDELARVGSEIAALGNRVVLAITAERDDVALHVAGRLSDQGESLARRAGVA